VTARQAAVVVLSGTPAGGSESPLNDC